MKSHPDHTYYAIRDALVSAAHVISSIEHHQGTEAICHALERVARNISSAETLAIAIPAIMAAERLLIFLTPYGPNWRVVADATAAARVAMDTGGVLPGCSSELAFRLAREAIEGRVLMAENAV